MMLVPGWVTRALADGHHRGAVHGGLTRRTIGLALDAGGVPTRADQSWGLGRLDDARYKGGWGPGPDGRYLVRQLGVVHRGGQAYPVPLAARADDGTFATGTTAVDLLAGWWAEALVEQAAPTRCTP